MFDVSPYRQALESVGWNVTEFRHDPPRMFPEMRRVRIAATRGKTDVATTQMFPNYSLEPEKFSDLFTTTMASQEVGGRL